MGLACVYAPLPGRVLSQQVGDGLAADDFDITAPGICCNAMYRTATGAVVDQLEKGDGVRLQELQQQLHE